MATGPKIVHKQFNSPMGLYSQNNIQETLNKHLQNLDNGTVGIDFNNPSTEKPGNLANSAVLRMLEEEERARMGYPKLDPTQVQAILDTLVHKDHRFDHLWPPQKSRMKAARSWDGQLNATGNIYSEFMQATKGGKKVVWPPVHETNGYHSPQTQQYNNAPTQQYQSRPSSQQSQHQPPQYKQPQNQYQQPQNQYQQPQNQYQQPQNDYQQPQQQYQQEHRPSFCEGRRQEPTGLSKLIPFGPGVTASPTPRGPVSPASAPSRGPVSPGAPQAYRQPNTRWGPVSAPLSPQAYGSQPNYQQQQNSPQTQQYSQPQEYQQYSEPAYQPPQRQFEPPPTTITLRQQPPIHQKPPPVFPSQPATTSLKGGVNMRGDMKWPPQSVREAVEAENEARRQLAKGPACRPRKVRKDYTSFFAQNALNSYYPGYRAPPGTQHYEDHHHSGRSSY